jgi:hypothetical protein
MFGAYETHICQAKGIISQPQNQNMKTAFVALVFVVVLATAFATELTVRAKFDAFKRKFERVYGGAEHEHRFNIFQV